jgi:hypothetical protein
MLCHESPVQFFSLLMLHGYLHWSGFYGNDSLKKRGAAYYTIATVLGIGTDWSAAVIAGLIWLWHSYHCLRSSSNRRLILWLVIIPAISLTAILVHIMWGCNWDINLFKALFISRTTAPQQPVTWAQWSQASWSYLINNFTVVGIAATVLYPIIILIIVKCTNADSSFRQIIPGRKTILPISLVTLQGILWVVVFKHQSYIHPYWQYFITPFLAFVLASVFLAAVTLFRKIIPPATTLLAVITLAAPMPFFAKELDKYHMYQDEELAGVVEAFQIVGQFVPSRVPVMTSQEYQLDSESFGKYTYYSINPQFYYYVNRSLIYSRDINDIEANREGCAAYVMELAGNGETQALAEKLYEKFNKYGHPIITKHNYAIFFLKEIPKAK